MKKQKTKRQALDTLYSERQKLEKSIAGCCGCQECSSSQEKLKLVTQKIEGLESNK